VGGWGNNHGGGNSVMWTVAISLLEDIAPRPPSGQTTVDLIVDRYKQKIID
jgi:hypothetical protein